MTRAVISLVFLTTTFLSAVLAMAAEPARPEPAKPETEALRAEVTELRTMVRELAARLSAIEKRLARLEKVTTPQGGNLAPAQSQVPATIEKGMQLDPVQQTKRLQQRSTPTPEAAPAPVGPPIIPGGDKPKK